jgi:hypothetical protein
MLLNSFARTLELKENWGGITTQTILEFDEPIKDMMIKLQKIETVVATEIPNILKSFSDCDVAFINSSLLFDLIKVFDFVPKSCETEHGDFSTALVRACTVSLEATKFLYLRKDVFDRDFYTAIQNAIIYGRTNIVEFLWHMERPLLQKIDLISMARKVGFSMLTFLVEKLKIVDDGMGLLNFCKDKDNSVTEYILAHNSYQPYIYWLMIYKCIIEDNLYVINLIIDKVDPNSKIAAILLTKAIEKKRSAMVPRFLFRYKFTFNGGIEFTEKSLLAQKEKFLTLIPDAAEIMKHMDAPYKYAESIGYEQFPIILKTYINNTVIKYKSIVMLKMLIQQGFSKDFLFTLCDWSQTSPEFVQIFMGIVFDTLDKINFFFTNCINLGNHHMIKYL